LDAKENLVKFDVERCDIRRMVSRMGLMVGAGEVWRRRSFRRLLWRRDVQALAQTPRSPSPHVPVVQYAKNRWFLTFYIINDFIFLYTFCFDRYRSGSQFKKD